jgi:hypothetical protein
MSLSGAARVDKKIIAHLSYGGDIYDTTGEMLVSQLISESLENTNIGNAVRNYGLSNKFLEVIYSSSIEELLPEPLIKHGIVPILVPSLLFIDQNMLPRILGHWIDSASGIYDLEIKDEVIRQTAIDFIVGLRDAADSKGKLLPWPKSDSPTLEQLEQNQGSGCLSIICILGILGVGVLTAINYT